MLVQMVGLFITAELVFIMICRLHSGQVKGKSTKQLFFVECPNFCPR